MKTGAEKNNMPTIRIQSGMQATAIKTNNEAHIKVPNQLNSFGVSSFISFIMYLYHTTTLRLSQISAIL